MTDRRNVEFLGRKLFCDPDLFLNGTGEEVIIEKFFDPKPGDVVFDVGAADSMWTLFALASGATVYAFEPSPPKFQELTASVLAAGFFDRAHLYRWGLDDHSSFKTLAVWYRALGGDEGLELSPDYCLAPTRFDTMDLFAVELARLDWIKIDVEAGELCVLQGARYLIELFRPTIILEDHRNIGRMGPWMLENKIWEKIYTLLQSFGYASFHEEPFCGRGFLVAKP